MDENTIGEIAKKLNISRSVVGRVLRHCGGVDAKTRQMILSASTSFVRDSYGECAVYLISPDVPLYFWRPLRRGIEDKLRALEIPFKTNICTRVKDESVLLRYLDEAEKLGAKAIILSARMTPAIQARLEALTSQHLIILLSEYHEIVNAFYVGSDAYRDGYAMGEYFLSHCADRPLLLLTQELSDVEQRIDGFCHALRSVDPSLAERAVRIKLDNSIFSDLKLLPSKLAPLLMEAAKPYEQLCIYAPMGIPQFPLAIIKAKLTERAVCLCQDCCVSQSDGKPAVRIVTCNQDGSAQSETAANYAIDFCRAGLYPKQKNTFIASCIEDLA